MNAIVVTRCGGPEVLEPRRIPDPEPAAGELLVRVRAVCVTHADQMMRAGEYHTPVPLPWTPGMGGAGVVERVGPGVRAFAPGDRVVLAGEGLRSYAELTRVPESLALALPEGAGFDEAAGASVSGLTAFWVARRVAQIAAGERVVVLGASGGVGHVLVQLARAAGAEVIATSSPDKAEWLRSVGAHHVIGHDAAELPARVRELTAGKGADVVLDGIGGPAFAAALRSLGHAGRCVAFANATLADTVMNTRDFYPKNATIHGFQISRRMANGWDWRPAMGELVGLVAAGALRIHAGAAFPLEAAADAHRALEARATPGLTVLRPS